MNVYIKHEKKLPYASRANSAPVRRAASLSSPPLQKLMKRVVMETS